MKEEGERERERKVEILRGLKKIKERDKKGFV